MRLEGSGASGHCGTAGTHRRGLAMLRRLWELKRTEEMAESRQKIDRQLLVAKYSMRTTTVCITVAIQALPRQVRLGIDPLAPPKWWQVIACHHFYCVQHQPVAGAALDSLTTGRLVRAFELHRLLPDLRDFIRCPQPGERHIVDGTARNHGA